MSFWSRTLAVCLMLAPLAAAAQRPAANRVQQQQRRMQKQVQEQIKEAIANQPKLPDDPQLLALHREFVTKAEKLAKEFERKKQYDRAREVFESMARLVPNYAEAEAGVQRMMQHQSIENRKLVDVQADEGWQDTGIVLQKDMPVHVEVKGTWRVVLEVGPEGLEIPEKLRPRDPRIKLGTLIGAIVNSPGELETAKPFVIKPGDDFVNKTTGRLFLRMYDIDPSDNEGKMLVLIQSSFGK